MYCPNESWRPTGEENLTWSIVSLLLLTIGLPFFVLASNSPLVQAWQSLTHAQKSPYRLYAMSNAGSMLALCWYPFLIERYFSVRFQSECWTLGFIAFGLLTLVSGWQTLKFESWSDSGQQHQQFSSISSRVEGDSLGFFRIGLVIGLTTTSSVLLLAVTNMLCQEVASVPMLWLIPLCLYLITFMLCFDRPGFYRRFLFLPLLWISVVACIVLIHLRRKCEFSFASSGLFACLLFWEHRLSRRVRTS